MLRKVKGRKLKGWTKIRNKFRARVALEWNDFRALWLRKCVAGVDFPHWAGTAKFYLRTLRETEARENLAFLRGGGARHQSFVSAPRTRPTIPPLLAPNFAGLRRVLSRELAPVFLSVYDIIHLISVFKIAYYAALRVFFPLFFRRFFFNFARRRPNARGTKVFQSHSRADKDGSLEPRV